MESIEIWWGISYLINVKDVLEAVAKHSPRNFYELKIYNCLHSKLLPEVLESFFISWKNRITKKSLSLIILKDYSTSEMCVRLVAHVADVDHCVTKQLQYSFTRNNIIKHQKKNFFLPLSKILLFFKVLLVNKAKKFH